MADDTQDMENNMSDKNQATGLVLKFFKTIMLSAIFIMLIKTCRVIANK
jgi:hypothetical protein